MTTKKARRKFVDGDTMPTLASDILAIDLSDLEYSHPLYREIREAKESINDEVAHARVLARRGLPPEEHWRQDPDDPRLAAWQKVHAETVDEILTALREWERSDDKVTSEGLARLVAISAKLSTEAQIMAGGKK